MRNVLIFRHFECEGPGYLGEYLARRGIPHELIAIDREQDPPPSIDGASALALMGGPMSANDPLPWIGPVLDLIRQAQASGLPVLGHCLGAQLIAKALGATVTPNAVWEIGWLPVQRDPGAPSWVQRLPERFEPFHWHGETFSLPAGARRLFSSPHCRNQGFQVGASIALQFHLELRAKMLPQWVRQYADDIRHPGATVHSAQQMLTGADARMAAAHAVADLVYAQWSATIS